MSDAPSLDALARLAAATARHLAALGSACVHPARPTPPRRCGSCAGCVADGVAQDALADGDVTIARGLVAAVDALRAERDRRDALAAAMREERAATATLASANAALGRAKARLHRAYAKDPDGASDAEAFDAREARDRARAAHAAALAHLDALLSGAAPDVVRAGVVRQHIGAVLAANGCDCPCDHGGDEHDDGCERCLACRAESAMVAALAAAEGR